MAYQSIEDSKEPATTADQSDSFLKSIKDGSRSKQLILFSLAFAAILLFFVLLGWQTDQAMSAPPAPVVMQPSFSSSELKYEKKISELQDQIDVLKQNPSNSTRDKEIETVRQELSNVSVAFNSLSDLVHAQALALDQLRVSIRDHQEQLSTLNRPPVQETANKVMEEKAIDDLLLFDSPPFRLLTVEYWEDKPTALLELNGKIKSVQAGDYVTQWKIVKINALARSIEVAPQNNLSQIQTLEAGA